MLIFRLFKKITTNGIQSAFGSHRYIYGQTYHFLHVITVIWKMPIWQIDVLGNWAKFRTKRISLFQLTTQIIHKITSHLQTHKGVERAREMLHRVFEATFGNFTLKQKCYFMLQIRVKYLIKHKYYYTVVFVEQ